MTRSGKIELTQGEKEMAPPSPIGEIAQSPEDEPLSQIIDELNRRFGTNFSDEDRVFIQQLESKFELDAGLAASVRVNPPDNAFLTFEHIVNDRLQEMMDANFRFYKQITDDEQLARFLLTWFSTAT